MSSLKEYLEKKYGSLSQNGKDKKKKKKGHSSQTSSVTATTVSIVDNDAEDILPQIDTDYSSQDARKIKTKKKPKWISIDESNAAGNTRDKDRTGGRAADSRDLSPPPPSPPRYGIQTAADLRRQTEYEEQQRKKMLESMTPNEHETVYRDVKTGRKINVKEIEAEEEAKRRREEQRRQAQREWNKGLVQRRELEAQRAREEQERHTPFSQYSREEYDTELKSKIHWDDPMRKQMMKKQQVKHKPRYPTYKGPPPPPNRFGIAPGYRWDGVDRSNGFEKQLLLHQNELKAARDNAYANSYME
ncbi:Pre-mRNA-splicing factor cwc26 [Spiromyces aspiralis]|uniref:Pre-mRNA-splicing factor cwc26 n=1 Tax=Spiromyces aspiralis TaxID=68401 RepID=A0ACC1I2P5_9FUNG|nr:Pre-mRNA-splicing factor cwc26 [Spiromyces aspiralis]